MKESLRKFIYHILYPTSLFFTILVLLFGAISTTAENPYSVPIVSTSGLLLILLFSLVFACLNRIFAVKSINTIGKILLHYVGTMLDFTIVFVLIGKNYLNSSSGTSGRTIFILIGILTLIYVLIAACILIFRSIFKKAEQSGKKTEYKSQFRKN